MKKTRREIFLLCLVFLIILTCGCEKISKTVRQTERKEIRIGILLYNQDDLFINILSKKLENEFREQEKKEDYKITVNVCDAKNSQTIQNNQIDDFIEQGYDVLCVNLIDRTDAATIIDKGEKAGISIVFFNREPVSADMERWEKTWYVGIDSEEGGKMQGQILLDQYNKEPFAVDRNQDGVLQYVLLEGEPGHQDTTIRTESCLKVLKDAGIRLERLATANANWRRTQGKEKMESWLDQFDDCIEVLISNNDEMALGALDAMEEKQIPNGRIKVIGLDGIEEAINAVKEGKMAGTVLNDAGSQAKLIVHLSVALGKGETPEDIPKNAKNRVIKVPHQIVLQ